ncbi:hypothetical protein N665_0116s0106 [Sinapis alba]|nr:hypothetical protein N665_0116s0106 [Sinapis alba]
MDHLPQKIELISCGPMDHISDIKLIRTDTTLDLSQKAEKGMNCKVGSASVFIAGSSCVKFLCFSMWDVLKKTP